VFEDINFYKKNFGLIFMNHLFGEVIKQKTKELGLEYKAVAEGLAPYFGIIRPNSVYNLLCSWSRGSFKTNQSKDLVKIIPRVSRLLYVLGVEEDHEVVKKFKQKYPFFEYPPEDSKIEGIKERILEAPKKKKLIKVLKEDLNSLDLLRLNKVRDYVEGLKVKKVKKGKK